MKCRMVVVVVVDDDDERGSERIKTGLAKEAVDYDTYEYDYLKDSKDRDYKVVEREELRRSYVQACARSS